MDREMKKIVEGVFLRGAKYWLRYSVGGRQVRESTGQSNLTFARQALAARVTQIKEGRFFDIKRESKVRFSELVSLYVERHSKPNKKAWHNDVHYFKPIKRFFGNIVISKVTQGMVEDYIADRLNSVGKCSVNRELTMLKSMFAKAVEWEKLSMNPCVRLRKFKEPKRSRFLTKEEITRLIGFCKQPNLLDAVLIALHTGMRRNELRYMRWVDLNFDRNEIRLPLTKNGEERYIPMNAVVKNILLRRRIRKENSFWVFPGESEKKPYDFRSAFETAREKADLADVRFHDLRHTFASHLAMQGVQLLTIAQLLGHKDIKMTQRYSHLTSQHKADAVQLLDNLTSTVLAQSGVGKDQPEIINLTSSELQDS